MIAAVVVYGLAVLAAGLIVGRALRERGRAFDDRRRNLEEALGRPLTPAETWSLYE